MTDDRLSEMFDLVEVSSVMTGGIAARGGWRSRGPLADPVKFFAAVAGRAELTTDGVDAPVELAPGDVAMLIGRSWVGFRSGDEPRREVQPESDFSAEPFASADQTVDDIVIGGCVTLTPAGRALLLGALPPLVLIRASSTGSDRLRAAVHRVFDEATGDRMGSAFAMRQHGRLLLLEMLRAYLDQSDLPPGPLRLMGDARLGPALGLMHSDPARGWSLDELARSAAMSRTSFAVRFREVAGMPPVTYLTRWRMLLAQRHLRDADIQVGELAVKLGYGSESAFSTAFKRLLGESPLHYRRRVRAAA